jgi:molecular chaperone DnaK
MSKKNYVIGCDLGTTNSCIAIIEGGQPTIIANAEGKRTTPSVVAFTKNGERKIGDPAKRQAVTNSVNTIYSIKRLIGKDFNTIGKEKTTYKVVDKAGVPCVDIEGKVYTPQEISAMILSKLKQTAEDFLGTEITEAVITVPAYFGDAERSATIEAGKIAGLNVLRIINEPTAAALAYGLDKKGTEQKICVFDCGGGTHDVSVLEIGDGVFEVKSTDGDTHLGGDDFDQAIMTWLIDDFRTETGFDINKDPMALQRVKDACEKAKIELSAAVETEINLPYITSIDNVPQHLVKKLTRAKFEQMISGLVDRTIKCCVDALDKAKISPKEIDEVVLVGGSTRIPAIQEAVEKLFGKKANKSVNPDEVVAIGAAIQGGVLKGDIKDVLLLDVTPLSIGIETMGGVFTKLIEANTTIPTDGSQTFSTASDNQSSVEIHILQGERTMAKDNRSLGKFILDGIMPAPRGVPQIEVKLDLDANSVLTVTAKDKATGKQNQVKIQGGSQLSKEEIERMKREAEINAESDKKEREKVDTLNKADTLIFSTEKQIKEFGDKLTEDNKTELNSALSELKEAHKSANVENIDSSINKLNETWNKISTNLYSTSNEQSSATDDSGSTNNTDDTVEAEFEEVK